MTAGPLLARFRAENQISQVELARRLGICRVYVGEIERGARSPGRRLAIAIEDLTRDWARGQIAVRDWDPPTPPTRPGLTLARPGLAVSHVGAPRGAHRRLAMTARTEPSPDDDYRVLRLATSRADRELLSGLATRALNSTRDAVALATIGRLIAALESPP